MSQPLRDPYAWFMPEMLLLENEHMRKTIMQLLETRINPPVILKERPVIGEGLIVAPIKGTAL